MARRHGGAGGREMQEAARRRLLEIARASVTVAVRGAGPVKVTEANPELQGKQGCFVTLKRQGRLRGCLGHFTGDKPLYEMVNETARTSATGDARFFSEPITAAEIPELEIEISVLSPLRRVKDPLSIELGVHGIYIRKGHAGGCFLPQVASETGWTKEEFLGNCCAHKAGLSPRAWAEPETEVSVFTAEVFGEGAAESCE